MRRIGRYVPESLLILVIVLLIGISGVFGWQFFQNRIPLSLPVVATRDPRTCQNFPSQAAAQAAYSADPARLAHLDRDADGLACESNR